MKNHALVTTLAVLLAVSLSAIVAFVVSGEVLGPRLQTAAEPPAAVVIDVAGLGDTQSTQSVEGTAETPPAQTGNTPGSSGTESTGTNNGATDTTDTADTPDTNAGTPDTGTADDGTPDAADAPNSGTDTETPDNGGDQGDNPDLGDGGGTPGNDTPDNGGDQGDNPDLGDPPCAGTVVDGDCVPPISILCLLGYELVGDSCVFVGCPLGYQFADGVCTQLVEGIPCPGGTIRNDAGDCEPLVVFDPPIVQPDFCIDGYKYVDGACVSICADNLQWINGFCLGDLTVNPGVLIPNLDLATLATS